MMALHELMPPSTSVYDAVTPGCRLLQIKTTQRTTVGIYEKPDWLLILKRNEDGSMEEVYYGPGDRPWRWHGRCEKWTEVYQLEEAKAVNRSG